MLEEPQCSKRQCRYYEGVGKQGGSQEEKNEVQVCLAFPEGIPYDIAYGDNLHLKPVKGDNDIQFEKTP